MNRSAPISSTKFDRLTDLSIDSRVCRSTNGFFHRFTVVDRIGSRWSVHILFLDRFMSNKLTPIFKWFIDWIGVGWLTFSFLNRFMSSIESILSRRFIYSTDRISQLDKACIANEDILSQQIQPLLSKLNGHETRAFWYYASVKISLCLICSGVWRVTWVTHPITRDTQLARV